MEKENYAKVISHLLDLTKPKLQSLIGEMDSDESPQQDAAEAMEVHSICYKLACKVSLWHEKVFPAIVQWLPSETQLLEDMTLLRCESPWSFILSYNSEKPVDMSDISTETIQHYIETPKSGTFLLYQYGKRFFRGVLIDVLTFTRLKVMNIDTGEYVIVSKSAVYHIPKRCCEVHALSLHCTISDGEDKFIKDLWSHNLEIVFETILKQCSFSAEIFKLTNNDIVPKYAINLVGINADGHRLNVTDWFLNSLIPEMKLHHPQLSHNNELIYFLGDKLLDPFSENGKISNEPNNLKDSLSSALSPRPRIFPTKLCQTVRKAPSSIGASTVNRQPSPNLTRNNSEPQKLATIKSVSDINRHNCLSLYPNNVCYPDIGDKMNIFVSEILDDLSFYAIVVHAGNKVMVGETMETYSALTTRLNDSKVYPKRCDIIKAPKIGALVVYWSNSLAEWARGIVHSIFGVTTVEMFNPDVGSYEVANISTLTVIHSEDKILPFQACLLSLHNIRPFTDVKTKAKEKFKNLIFDKKLYAVVKSLNFELCMLEVELIVDETLLSVNKALVESNLCSTNTLTI